MEHTLFVEKYRPQRVEDCILPDFLKKTFDEFIKNKKFPNLILHGPAGAGKTTIAKALCNELECDWILINASEDRNLDMLRTKVATFAGSISLNGGKKVIIFDEADYLNAQSTQPALRGVIEKFSKNCTFIFTCNFKLKILEAIHSRCSVIDFTLKKKEKAEIALKFFKRLCSILEKENISFEKKVVTELVMKYFPDFRRILNEVQRHSSSGKLEKEVLVDLKETNIDELLGFLKSKSFFEMRKWVGENIDNDFESIIRKVADCGIPKMENDSIPQAYLILDDYLFKSSFVADHEIHLTACLTEIMSNCRFK